MLNGKKKCDKGFIYSNCPNGLIDKTCNQNCKTVCKSKGGFYLDPKNCCKTIKDVSPQLKKKSLSHQYVQFRCIHGTFIDIF